MEIWQEHRFFFFFISHSIVEEEFMRQPPNMRLVEELLSVIPTSPCGSLYIISIYCFPPPPPTPISIDCFPVEEELGKGVEYFREYFIFSFEVLLCFMTLFP